MFLESTVTGSWFGQRLFGQVEALNAWRVNDFFLTWPTFGGRLAEFYPSFCMQLEFVRKLINIIWVSDEECGFLLLILLISRRLASLPKEVVCSDSNSFLAFLNAAGNRLGLRVL